MPGTTHASMHSAPLRKKSDALRSSARSGYLTRRLRHAVSPCDAICAVLEPSADLRVVRCGRCCSHTSGDTAPQPTSWLRRMLRVRQAAQMPSGATPLPLCFSQRPQHRPRHPRHCDSLSPWSASTRARVKPPGSPAATRTSAIMRLGPDGAYGMGRRETPYYGTQIVRLHRQRGAPSGVPTRAPACLY